MIFPDAGADGSVEGNFKSPVNLWHSKADSTFTLADAVRLMIEDLSCVSKSLQFRTSPPVESIDIKISESEKQQLEENIAKIEGELDTLKDYLRLSDIKRKEALNKLLDLKGSIRVFCRLRPFHGNEKRACPGLIVAPHSDKVVVKAGGKLKAYHFDKVFLPEDSQDDVFEELVPILRSALDGHNVCIFAYGQTGTGKTYTMEGRPDSPGVVPHTFKELFRQAALDSSLTFTFTISMLEVYKGSLRDLLVCRPTRPTEPSAKCLSIQMDAPSGVEIENLHEVLVMDFKQAFQWYRIGKRARSTAWTNVNDASSRSHSLIRIIIRGSRGDDTYAITSKLWMVDLGGSERILKTRASGQTMEEAKAINLSLSALGDVISALQKKQPHIPYRNSKLTQILRDSLGNDSKVVMLLHISPKEDDLAETVCSLNFGTRVRGIQLGREMSTEDKEQRTHVMADITLHMRHLEDECEQAIKHIQTVEVLLREKKKVLKSELSSENQMTQTSTSQEQHAIEIESADSCSILDRSIELNMPRFMSPTACSRLRGRAQDKNSISPCKEIKREERNGTRVSLPNYARAMPNCSKPSTIRQSQLNSEFNYNKMLKYPMANNKGVAVFVSKQGTIDESECVSEFRVKDDHELRCPSIPQRLRVSGGPLSKQVCTADESQHLETDINNGMKHVAVPKKRRFSGSYCTKCTTDQIQCLSEPNLVHGLRSSPSTKNKRTNGSPPKQFTTDGISQSISEGFSPEFIDSDQISSPVPEIQKQASFRKKTLSNKHLTKINSMENGHRLKQNSIQSPINASPRITRTSYRAESKHGEATYHPILVKVETGK